MIFFKYEFRHHLLIKYNSCFKDVSSIKLNSFSEESIQSNQEVGKKKKKTRNHNNNNNKICFNKK